jgi:hypothetical protein
MKQKQLQKRQMEYAQGLQNDPAKTIWVDMGVGAYPTKPKAETKQELKDRIAELEVKYRNQVEERQKVDRINYNQREELHTAFAHIDWLTARAKRATIAAYVCLAVIFIMVGAQVIW